MFEHTDSVLRIRAGEFLWTLKRSLAKETDNKLALHPMPERLKLRISFLKLNLLMNMEAREGVGHTILQFMMRMSILFGLILSLEMRF